MRLRNCFQKRHSFLPRNFYRSNWIWKANGRLQFQKYPTHQCTKMLQRGTSSFSTKKFSKLSKSLEFYYLEPGLCLSITDIVEAMTTAIRGRHIHSESCITVNVSRGTQKVVIKLAKESHCLAFFSTDFGNTFGSNVGKEFGVMLRVKGPNKPEIAYDIVRIHCLMICTDLTEDKTVGDANASLVRCFPFISKLKAGDILTTGQYMNSQTFTNL